MTSPGIFASRALRRANIGHLIATRQAPCPWSGRDGGTAGLIPFDEASRRLRLVNRSYTGIQPIPIDRIVGSVGRSHDFGRDFRLPPWVSRSRLASLRSAYPDGDMPAIDVFEVGGGYFVEDGHHRVALARERHVEFIDAAITRLQTSYAVSPDVDVCQLVHTEQQRMLLEDSGLSRARPDAVIEFTLKDGYTQLAEIIKAHGYDLARRKGALPAPKEVAADWYDTVYLPGLDAVRRTSLPERHASWRPTDADLFLWVYKLRRDLRGHDSTIDFDAAAQHARQVNKRRSERRDFLREGRRPLPRQDS
jgi:hypothetical protein